MLRMLAFIGLFTAILLARPAITSAASPANLERNVFSAGEDGYKVFRIPAVVRSQAGSLLAFCEARQGGDASEIDLVLKRSSDGGNTWAGLQVVCESEDYASLYPEGRAISAGNPAPVVDRIHPTSPGRIWLPFTIENDRVFVKYSDDDGATWSSDREITQDVKLEQWGWYATGPVHSIQILHGPSRGRLVIPCDHRLGGEGKDKGPLGAHAIVSSDHGETWRLGAIDDSYEDALNANETAVVELGDGTLYFNTRDQHGTAPGTRGETFSYDGGHSFSSRDASWQGFRPADENLDPPVVQSSLLRLKSGPVVFCGPDDNGPSGAGRSDLRLRIANNFNTKMHPVPWSDGPLIHEGPAAYSDLVEVSPGQLGILYECGKKGPYEHIRFQSIPAASFLLSTNDNLPRSTPESMGVDSQGLIDFINAADVEVESMHSLMVIRNGHVLAEAWWSPESAEKPHVLWSLSKSFTSTAVGLAIDEGKLSIDDRIVDLFPNLIPEDPSDNLRKMRVRDLLTMTAGHQIEVNLRLSNQWRKDFLAHEVPHKPGTHFRYNTPATYMLSAIVQKVTGERVVDYLQPRLFAPLQIAPPRWDESPEGISLGGYGLYLTTEDIAKFGQLLLQRGSWQGKQLVPPAWIQQATSRQVSNGSSPDSDWDQGYGFQFWQSRHGAYRGDGKDGQFCIVIPEQNAVVVMTANSKNLQAQLALVWKHLLPAMKNSALPESPSLQKQLKEISANLSASR